jgi:hypothetical protein
MSFVRTTTRHSRPSGAAATRKEMLTCQVSSMRILRLVRPTRSTSAASWTIST